MSATHPVFIISYLVEAGCLGAQGAQKIDDFCIFLKQKFEHGFPSFCCWNISPKTDIHQSHIQYSLNKKRLSGEQASRYLNAYNLNIKTFEHEMDDFAIDFIEEFLGR